MKKTLNELKRIYESDLKSYGISFKGVGWNDSNAAIKRYEIMSDLFLNDRSKKKIIDFGCGLSHFYDFLTKKDLKKIKYTGMDISEKMIEISKKKYPKNYYICGDILLNSKIVPNVDYIIINGLFTQKGKNTNKDMKIFMKKIIKILYKKASKGIAFNCMSPNVDWRNKKNFYLEFNYLFNFINKLSKNFVLIHNYGLYEYTCYLYKHPKGKT